MKFTLFIDQRAVIESGITGVDAIDLLVFDVAANAINCGNLDEPEIIDGKKWYWVSYGLLIGELPLLSMSRPTIKRRIANLVAAGLLVKSSVNEDQRKLFMALGPKACLLTSDKVGRVKNEPRGGFRNDPTPGSEMTRYKNTSNKNTINQSIDPHSQANGEDTSDEKVEKVKKTVKRKPTRLEVQSFYENEKINSLEAELPKELRELAAAAKITMEMLVISYAQIIDHMMKPSDAWPSGMWGCVLTIHDQLSFSQFCKLVLVQGMKRVEIKAYLDTWENKGYKNTSIYATFVAWRGRENNTQVAQSQVAGVASIPKKNYTR